MLSVLGYHRLIAPKPNLLVLPLPPLASFRARLSALASTRYPMAPSKVVAEYAKSNRSSCKGCGKNIAGGSLRLGSSVRDPRGFDSVKWYHFDCFPTKSHSINIAEEISGFSILKDCDKDALRKLHAAEASKRTANKACTGSNSTTEESNAQSSKKPKIGSASELINEEQLEKEAKQENSVNGKENCFKIDFLISNVKDNYKDATLSSNWKAFKTVIFRNREDGLHDSEKIAAFDFDGCLANTSVKRTGADAWSLMYPSIPEKLQGLYNKGYKLVIFTNESNIERWKNKRQQAVDSKIGRLDNFMKCVKVPIQVFIACGLGKNKDQSEDPFRKPQPGMWQLFKQHFNSGITIDMDQSFYVGDAAGRTEDHSDADIKFAQAVGLKFYVPEEFFLSN